MPVRKYTEEELRFLESGWRQWGLDDLTRAFNSKFGTDKTPGQIRSCIKKNKFKCGRSTGALNKGKFKLVTSEQADWLKDKYKELSREELTKAFNENFGTSLTQQQITAFVKNHGIKSGRSGHWATRPSWNKGTAGQGVCKPNSGSFKSGNVPVNVQPLFTERVGKDGYIEIKVPEPNPYTKAQTRYVHKHRWIWEQKHGPIPEGHAVIFKDGNRHNFDDDNLEAISRRQLSLLNARKYFDSPNELKETIWNLVKLECATIGMEMSDGSKSQRQLVQEQISKPSTSREIADKTGIKPAQVNTLLWLLKKRGAAKVVGKEKRNGKTLNLWVSEVAA